jgi:hypothetical protein
MKKFIVSIQGNSEKTFDSINSALNYARLEVYASNATIIQAFDTLQDGKLAQWCYGFKSLSIHSENQGA